MSTTTIIDRCSLSSAAVLSDFEWPERGRKKKVREDTRSLDEFGTQEELDRSRPHEAWEDMNARVCNEIRLASGSRKWVEGRREFGAVRQSIVDRDGGVCQDCGADMRDVHHITPLCKGGSNAPENLVSLCLRCHRKRHSRS